MNINDYSVILRKDVPSSVAGDIQGVQPITEPKEYFNYETIQCVEVDDPRNTFPKGEYDKVRIVRVLKRIPKFDAPKYHFYLEPRKEIEVIKEYTFDEWDKFKDWNSI